MTLSLKRKYQIDTFLISQQQDVIDNPSFLAEYLNKNFDKMDEIERKIFISKCLTNHKINNILLNFELENLIPRTKKLSLRNFIGEVKKLLSRYKLDLLEDKQWIVMCVNRKKVIFKNSIPEVDINNYETENYIQNITKLLEAIINFDTKIIITNYKNIKWINIESEQKF